MNKIKGKREFFYAEEKLVSWRIGYSLGTVYKIGINSDKYELYNFGYCPSLDEFYYNKSIRLPKKLIEYFERFRFPSEELEEEMMQIGIYHINDSYKLVREYEDAKACQKLCVEKIKKLNRNLIRKK